MIATTIDMGRAFTDNGGGGGVRRSRIGVVLELAKTAGPVVTARSVAEKQLLERQQLAIGTWLLAKKKQTKTNHKGHEGKAGNRKSNNQKQKSHHYFAGVTVTRT